MRGRGGRGGRGREMGRREGGREGEREGGREALNVESHWERNSEIPVYIVDPC